MQEVLLHIGGDFFNQVITIANYQLNTLALATFQCAQLDCLLHIHERD